jgi:hypothetical protein
VPAACTTAEVLTAQLGSTKGALSMSEAQPTIPLLVMWQRTLRIRQCMNQEHHLHEAIDEQDMTPPQTHSPTSAEQALTLFCQQEHASMEEAEGSDERLWWEEFAQETNWAQWNDDVEWTDWNKT